MLQRFLSSILYLLFSCSPYFAILPAAPLSQQKPKSVNLPENARVRSQNCVNLPENTQHFIAILPLAT
jgi:hypothetical protein